MDSQNKLDSRYIIEAIDGCRKRKARPDIERIIKWIHRKYSFAKEEILQALNASVEDGSVIKVRYKDSISYRNPAKFTRNSAHNYVATMRQHQAIIARSKAAQNSLQKNQNAQSQACSSSCTSLTSDTGATAATTHVTASSKCVPGAASHGGISSVLSGENENSSSWKASTSSPRSASFDSTPHTANCDTSAIARSTDAGAQDAITQAASQAATTTTAGSINSSGKVSTPCLNVPRLNVVRSIAPNSANTSNAPSAGSSSVLPINAVKRILRIIRQIVLQQGDTETTNRGASIPAILANLHAQRQLNYTETFVARVLKRATSQGTVNQLPNGNYILAGGLKKAIIKKGNSSSTNHGAIGGQSWKRSVGGIAASSCAPNSPSGGALASSAGPHSTAFGSMANQRNAAFRPSARSSIKFSSRNSNSSEPQRASKRRKFKKDLGPDFLEPSDLGMPYLSESFEPKCNQCALTESKNKLGKPERFLECKDCEFKAHPSCMQYPAELVYRCRQSPWQCVFCKDCCKCEGSGQVESILLCDLCDKGYHMQCHDPPLLSKPPGSWVCSDCQASSNRNGGQGIKGKSSGFKTHETESDAGFDETSASSGAGYDEEDGDDGNMSDGESGESSSISEEAILPKKHTDSIARDGMEKIFLNLQPSLEEIAAEFPGIRNKPDDWTPEDVESFIKVIGFPEQAACFREQEIDGIALLLLKRVDILTGMSLKLGPALKIYGQIQRLQTIHNQ